MKKTIPTMKLDTDTIIESHLKHIELSLDEVESACECKGANQEMAAAVAEVRDALERFKALWREAREERGNL